MKLRPISQVTSRMGAVLLLCIILMAACSPISNWIGTKCLLFSLPRPLIYALRLLAFLLPARLLPRACSPKKPNPMRPSGTPEHWIAWAVLGYGICLPITTAVLSVGLGGPTFQILTQDPPPDFLPEPLAAYPRRACGRIHVSPLLLHLFVPLRPHLCHPCLRLSVCLLSWESSPRHSMHFPLVFSPDTST